MKEQVELYPAHGWDCPDCGRQNFCRGVTLEQSGDEKRKMVAEIMGVEPFEVPDDALQGDWMTAPEEVDCVHCGESFGCQDMRDDWPKS